MDIDTAALLAEANAYAQRKFHDMMEAKSYSEPEAPETRAYVMAESIIREIVREAQLEREKAGKDERQAGDHFVGMPG